MIRVRCCPAGTILIDDHFDHFLVHACKWAYTGSTHVYHTSCQCTCAILHVHSGLGIPHSPVDNNTLLLPCHTQTKKRKTLGNEDKCLLFLWVVSHQQHPHPILLMIYIIASKCYPVPSSSPPLSNNNTVLPNQLVGFHTEGGTGIPPQGNLRHNCLNRYIGCTTQEKMYYSWIRWFLSSNIYALKFVSPTGCTDACMHPLEVLFPPPPPTRKKSCMKPWLARLMRPGIGWNVSYAVGDFAYM